MKIWKADEKKNALGSVVFVVTEDGNLRAKAINLAMPEIPAGTPLPVGTRVEVPCQISKADLGLPEDASGQ